MTGALQENARTPADMHWNNPFGPVRGGAQNGIFCRIAIFWRMRGEVQQYGTVAPGQEEYESGLRDRPPCRPRAGLHTDPVLAHRARLGPPGRPAVLPGSLSANTRMHSALVRALPACPRSARAPTPWRARSARRSVWVGSEASGLSSSASATPAAVSVALGPYRKRRCRRCRAPGLLKHLFPGSPRLPEIGVGARSGGCLGIIRFTTVRITPSPRRQAESGG